MLKRLLLSVAICLMFFSPMVVLAEGNEISDTNVVEIEDDKTPESARKRNYTSYYIGVGILLLTYVAIMANRKKQGNGLELIVDNIEDNKDGSYTVYLGYDNRSDKTIKFEDGDVGLKVVSGNAILLKKDDQNKFKSGNQKDTIIVVINKDSKIEYYAGNKHIVIDGSKLENKKEEK